MTNVIYRIKCRLKLDVKCKSSQKLDKVQIITCMILLVEYQYRAHNQLAAHGHGILLSW